MGSISQPAASFQTEILKHTAGGTGCRNYLTLCVITATCTLLVTLRLTRRRWCMFANIILSYFSFYSPRAGGDRTTCAFVSTTDWIVNNRFYGSFFKKNKTINPTTFLSLRKFQSCRCPTTTTTETETCWRRRPHCHFIIPASSQKKTKQT